MTTQPFIESGMTFGPFPDGHCFHIEKSPTYETVQRGVQIAEFLLLRIRNGSPPTVWVVEAKSSTPRPGTQPNFDDFIDEIREKLTNALSLYLAVYLRRHASEDAELPMPFKELDLSTTDFRLVLVVNNHKEDWLPPLKDALAKVLHATVKTWALSASAVVVINDALARSHGLIDVGR